MPLKSTEQTYGSVARALHWGIALLIVLQIVTGYGAGEIMSKDLAFGVHKPTGMVILVLIVARLAWMVLDATRPGDAELAWEKWPSRLVKWGMLALSLALPISGWLMSSAADKPISLYGLYTFPSLTAPDKSFAHDMGELHETLGTLIALALAAHVAGALRHHYLLKDRILDRMLGR